MVGGYHVYRSVPYALDKGCAVLFSSQRRIHFETPVLTEAVIVKHQIVRRRLAGDVYAAPLCAPYKLNAFGARNVADVIGAACLLAKSEISFNGAPFALAAYSRVTVPAGIFAVVYVSAAYQGRVLAVRRDDFAENLCFKHCLSHKLFRLHAAPIVGKGAAVRRHCRKIGKCLAFFAHGERSVRVHSHRGVPLYNFKLLFKRRSAVGHRIEVRHGANVGISAVRRRKGACFNAFFIRKSRFSEMYVYITESREDNCIFYIRNTNGRSICGNVERSKLFSYEHSALVS